MHFKYVLVSMFIMKDSEQSNPYQKQKVQYGMFNIIAFVFWYLCLTSMYLMRTTFFLHKFTISEYPRFSLCRYSLKGEATKSFSTL